MSNEPTMVPIATVRKVLSYALGEAFQTAFRKAGVIDDRGVHRAIGDMSVRDWGRVVDWTIATLMEDIEREAAALAAPAPTPAPTATPRSPYHFVSTCGVCGVQIGGDGDVCVPCGTDPVRRERFLAKRAKDLMPATTPALEANDAE